MKNNLQTNTGVAHNSPDFATSLKGLEMWSLVRGHAKLFFSAIITAVLFCLTASADITNNLVAYYKLDETTGLIAADATGNGHNASLINFPGDDSQWIAAGRTNGACNFNAGFIGTQYADIDDSGNGLNFSVSTSHAVTVAAWVRGALGATQTNGAAIVTRGYGRGGEQYILDLFQNSFRFGVRDAGGVGYTIQLTPAASNTVSGTWQHVVGVFDASGTTNALKLYINGQLIGQTNGPTTLLNNVHDVTIGEREDNIASGYNLPFTGLIDDVHIYNRGLAAADVVELYQAAGNLAPQILIQPVGVSVFAGDPVTLTVLSDGTTPLTNQWQFNGTNITGATNASFTIPNAQLTNAGAYSVIISNIAGFTTSSNAVLNVSDPAPNLTNGVVAYLLMDETSGLTAFDSTPNGHNANLINFPGDNSQWVAGRINGALQVTNGAYATIDDSTGALDFGASGSPAFSIAVWVRGVPGVEGNNAGIVTKGFGNGGEQFDIDVVNNAYRFLVRDGTGTNVYSLQSSAQVDGSWQQLAAVFNNTNGLRFYVNGLLVGSRLTGPATLFDNLHEISIGARESGIGTGYDYQFTGKIDDLHIYNRALTPTEVSLLYQAAGAVAPTFVTQPVGASRFVLDNYTFTSVADGTVPITYQWRINGTNILNATNATLTLNLLQTTNTGNYSVAVTNAVGFAISSDAVLTVSALASNDITTALVAWWQFDETNGTTVHDSAGTNSATLYQFQFADSNAQWVPGRVGHALRFNAAGSEENGTVKNDYVWTDNPIRFPYSSNLFTFAFWLKAASLTDEGTNPRIISPGVTSGTVPTPWILWRRSGGNAPAFGAYDPKRSDIPALTWKHFVVTWDTAAGSYSLYINGLLATNFATGYTRTVPQTTTNRWTIGHEENLAAAGDVDYYRGDIDDMRVYNRILTASQVAALYASAGNYAAIDNQPLSTTNSARDQVTLSVVAEATTGPITYQWYKNGTNILNATNSTLVFPYVTTDNAGTYYAVVSNQGTILTSSNAVVTVNPLPAADVADDLTAHWTFDETNSSTAADSSGNNNSASLYNFPDSISQWIPGVIGGALHFNATNEFVATDNGINFTNTDNFTFTFWAKADPGPQGTNPRLISPATLHWVLWRPTATAGVANPAGVGLYMPANSPQPLTNAWSHFVCVVNRPANLYTLYVNGTRVVINATPTGQGVKPVPSSFVQWIIGHSENTASHGDSFRGLLDDVRIYNRGFNLNDVEALYETGNIQPPLTISQSAGTLTLSWPSWAADYAPQSADALSPTGTVWTAVGGTATLNGATRSLTISAGSGDKYYRLKK